ncbi:hypothetical protein HYFRA_00011401 [Hymenoscyphus fraxineus]|uniref:Prion-inhibition and propagation HeLo domain-containing protein n=1 Tax=Hymenoscyphus fraxineus TaxID=746836 RepID=A0A9N9L475_9HELO|nr:hypothetical protein HYFRA_00011401 [Hymenoscyphus fraxineus]
MAEVAGLALSGLALASLFKTCIEIFEYLEQGKNWAKEMQLSITKVSLMRSRLSQWGTSLSIDTPITQEELRNRWPAEIGVISQSLIDIRRILASTTHICRRHAYIYDDTNASFCTWSIDELYTASLPSPIISAREKIPQNRHRGPLRTARSQIIWVLQDRKRFQELISDFDFLLTNLEKVGERLRKLQGDSKMAPPNVYAEGNNDMDFTITDPSETNIKTLSEECDPNSIEREILAQQASGSKSQGKHVFLKNVSTGDAELMPGNYYGTGVVPVSDQGHFYIGNKAGGNSSMVLGNTDGGTTRSILQDKRAQRAKEKAEAERAEKRAAEERAEKRTAPEHLRLVGLSGKK